MSASPGRRARSGFPLSLQNTARLAGGLWIAVIAAGIFAGLVRDGLVVSGDAAATAANVRAAEQLFRLGFVADLLSAMFYGATALLLYQLLKSSSRSMALFSAFAGVSGAVVMMANLTNLLGILYYLEAQTRASPHAAEHFTAMAAVSVRLHGAGYNISMVLFAGHLLMLAWLVLKSAYVPRILGILLAIAAFCWWLNSLAIFLSLPVASYLYPYIMLPGLLAEGSLAAWLLIRGVDASALRQDVQEIASNDDV